jgi:hypothetical protein
MYIIFFPFTLKVLMFASYLDGEIESHIDGHQNFVHE